MNRPRSNGLPDFWRSSGYFLLNRDAGGRLLVTDDFLRALLLRPEVVPPDEACDAERSLHERLLKDPHAGVSEADLRALADRDAAENLEIVLRFRDHLLRAGSLECAYLTLFRSADIKLPALFIDQMVHAILRGILEEETNALQARAAELFFREQRIGVNDGQIMAADDETVERLAATGGFGSLGQLLSESNIQTRAIDLDVLDEGSAASYWERSERFDTALDLTFARPGLDAFCRVLERWIKHFLGMEVRVHPVQSIRDERWRWHCGLDAQSSSLLNALYRGEEVGEEELSRLISLFRLTTKDEAAFIPDMLGRPVYLGLSMDGTSRLRVKPQNVLVNLPLAKPS